MCIHPFVEGYFTSLLYGKMELPLVVPNQGEIEEPFIG
jgi:hypothetical protein